MKKYFLITILIFVLMTTTACSENVIQLNPDNAVSNIMEDDETNPVNYPEINNNATTNENAVALSKTHEESQDYEWENSNVVLIEFDKTSVSMVGDGVTLEGSNVVINQAGTYQLSGVYENGQIVVNTNDKGIVRLILSGLDIRSSSTAPINIINAEKTIIVLVENTENTITDAATYLYDSQDVNEPNAAIFSKSDLTIYGTGSLTVNANYNDGIVSKDGLILHSGNITITAVDDGIRGKDYVVVKSANLTLNSQGDGIKSDNEEDASLGFISLEAGAYYINVAGDAITAQTNVLIMGGDFDLTTGGGTGNWISETESAKGIKAGVDIEIENGLFHLNTADDAFNANDSLTINDGKFYITTGNDGIHADSQIEINGGNIDITQSYEGIESSKITIIDGLIHIQSSDDGLNVAGGNDGSGMQQGMGMPGGKPGQRGEPGQDTFTYTGTNFLYINGGTVVIDADGDGVDVNGAMEMSNGILIVNGPTENMNGALDVDSSFNITGGTIIAAGSAGMAEAPGLSSSQNSILINFSSIQQAGTLFHLQNSNGEEIVTFAPTKTYQSIAFSSPNLLLGESYAVYLGGSSTEKEADGLFQTGNYNGGSEYTSFKISEVTTMIGDRVRK
ncbi:MAG: dockerin type 1 [Anaerolineaceae bacterium]|nr:dockerin type 1 [Anaerolineaceae bacterium]